MIGGYEEICKCFQKVASDSDYTFSNEPVIFEDEVIDYIQFPMLVAKHKQWSVSVTGTLLMDKLPLIPFKFVLQVSTKVKAIKEFDVLLKNSEGLGSMRDFLKVLSKALPKPEDTAPGLDSPSKEEALKFAFPTTLNPARTSVTEIDLHYEVMSSEPDLPEKLLAYHETREALLAVPRVGLRIMGARKDKVLPGVLKDVPKEFAEKALPLSDEGIGTFELIGSDETERIKGIVRLHFALLDRLQQLEFISNSPVL